MVSKETRKKLQQNHEQKNELKKRNFSSRDEVKKKRGIQRRNNVTCFRFHKIGHIVVECRRI